MATTTTTTETIIVNPARIPAAGIAGGMLVLLAALPGHAHVSSPARTPCNASARGAAACQETKEAAPRRQPSRAATQQECARIDAAIRTNEQAEQRIGARGVMESLQHDLLILRQRYRELRC